MPPPPPPRRSDLVHLTGKWCEGEGIFGFDEVDNFTVELIPCWHSFPVQFETRHGVMCHAASEREEKHKTWTLKKKQKTPHISSRRRRLKSCGVTIKKGKKGKRIIQYNVVVLVKNTVSKLLVFWARVEILQRPTDSSHKVHFRRFF